MSHKSSIRVTQSIGFRCVDLKDVLNVGHRNEAQDVRRAFAEPEMPILLTESMIEGDKEAQPF